MRLKALDDLRYRAGDQWPEEIVRQRRMESRPCLTINRLPQFVRQITNDQRQNRPAIKVSPVDDYADKEKAKILQGIIRHIEVSSQAATAYDKAFAGAVTKGFGYMRLVTDYADESSFDLELKIEPIYDDFSVYIDPYAKKPDGSDMQWAFVAETISKENYEHLYGESKLASMDWRGLGHHYQDWISKDSCLVVEYFWKEYKKRTLCKVLFDDQIEIMFKEDLPQGFEGIIEQREVEECVVHWDKLNGVETLESTIWPGKDIPIIPVYGEEIFVDGERIFEGIIRHAKDPQKMYNYWATAETEMIALAPKAPYIAPAGTFKGFERNWREANNKTFAYLEYNPKTLANGSPAPAPQRNFAEPPVQAITNARMLANEDIKGATGIYDPSLGNRSNETSGIAIQRRAAQSETSNFHFIDNLSRSLTHLGRMLVDIIPKIYDGPRVLRIIGEEGDEKIVRINQVFEEMGQQKQYDLSVGKYDVTVETGPAVHTKRQEAVNSMLEMVRANPQTFQLIGDLLVKNMDWPGSEEFAERLRKTLPPEIIEQEDSELKDLPPDVQVQFSQMQKQITMLNEQLQQASDIIQNKRIETESKERIETMKTEADLRIALLKETGADNRASFEQEIKSLDAKQRMNELSGGMQPAGNKGVH